jgi:hypothetical protein
MLPICGTTPAIAFGQQSPLLPASVASHHNIILKYLNHTINPIPPMSYTTRLQRQRNPHLYTEGKQEKFFSRQQGKAENSSKAGFFQTKLTVNEPGDKYEKEADAMAENKVQEGASVQKKEDNGGSVAFPGLSSGIENGNQPVVQKQEAESAGDSVSAGAATGTGTSACGIPATCPSEFCNPFPFKFIAEQARDSLKPGLLFGISQFVNPRVVPLWEQYLDGGTSPQNLSTTFGADFMSSATTRVATAHLMTALKAELRRSSPVFPAGQNAVVLSLSSLILPAINDLDVPGESNEMNFDIIGEIPGNIAGGIGKTQTTCPVGARPSPFDDRRFAEGTVTIVKQPDGSLFVIPVINFTVQDTIDLCPGNCGALKEMAATVPMSKMEASGVAGDVPFTVNFLASPLETIPFSLPAPTSPVIRMPAKVRVKASPHLRIREAPGVSAPVVGNYPDHSEITILCIRKGESVFGNDLWGKTDLGFVADFHLEHLDTNLPPDC